LSDKDAFQDNPEFQAIVDRYNGILMLLLQTLNDLLDVGSNHSDSEGYFDPCPDLSHKLDESTQTYAHGPAVLFDAEVQTCEDTWEKKFFRVSRENEMMKNDIETYELEKKNIVIKLEG
jgi:hypothetical protein